jgi:hypothetical protein
MAEILAHANGLSAMTHAAAPKGSAPHNELSRVL